MLATFQTRQMIANTFRLVLAVFLVLSHRAVIESAETESSPAAVWDFEEDDLNKVGSVISCPCLTFAL